MDKEIKAILGVVGGIIVTVGGVVLHMLMVQHVIEHIDYYFYMIKL